MTLLWERRCITMRFVFNSFVVKIQGQIWFVSNIANFTIERSISRKNLFNGRLSHSWPRMTHWRQETMTKAPFVHPHIAVGSFELLGKIPDVFLHLRAFVLLSRCDTCTRVSGNVDSCSSLLHTFPFLMRERKRPQEETPQSWRCYIFSRFSFFLFLLFLSFSYFLLIFWRTSWNHM